MITDPKILAGLVCPYCKRPTVHCNDAVIYGKTYGGMMYVCLKCDAYVGCHKQPPYGALGRLANEDLRQLKIEAHAAFDPLWKRKAQASGITNNKARGLAYKWLANQLGIDAKYCHIGMFDIAECRLVIKACKPYLIKPMYTYLLCDDGGVSHDEKEFILPLKATFSHEYGTYRVDSYHNANGDIVDKPTEITQVCCERISK